MIPFFCLIPIYLSSCRYNEVVSQKKNFYRSFIVSHLTRFCKTTRRIWKSWKTSRKRNTPERTKYEESSKLYIGISNIIMNDEAMRTATLALAFFLSFLLLITQSPHAFADNSNKIEKVEIKDGMKIIYYKNGLKEMSITIAENVNVASSFQAQTVVYIQKPSPPDFREILRFIEKILESVNSMGVGCALLAWAILNQIKKLRRGRPRDYRFNLPLSVH